MSDEIPDFEGWYDRGYLPHRDTGRPTMITYRLADSLPREVVEELLELPEEERGCDLERYLDAGHGNCVLERNENAAIVEENLKHFDEERYRLVEWVVMPNHVHVLYENPQAKMETILHSWRSYTSKQIQKNLSDQELPEDGRLWQRGAFDRFIRDKKHHFYVRCYILLNPVQAGLVENPWDWQWSSAKEYEERGLADSLRRWYREWRNRFPEAIRGS